MREDPAPYDLLITDFTMTKLTGIDLVRKVMVIRPDLPVLPCSGLNDPMIRKRVRKLGLRLYLKKPLSRRQHAEAVRQTIDSKNEGN